MTRMPRRVDHRNDATQRMADDDRSGDADCVAEGTEVVGARFERPRSRIVPRRTTVSTQVQVHDLRQRGQRGEVGLEVRVVITTGPTVDENNRRSLTHGRTVGDERLSVDVEPQSRPVHVHMHEAILAEAHGADTPFVTDGLTGGRPPATSRSSRIERPADQVGSGRARSRRHRTLR